MKGVLCHQDNDFFPRKSPQPTDMTSSDLILLPSKVSFHFLGTENSNMVPKFRRIWRVINQFKATVMHTSHCNHRLCVQEHCPGEIGLPSSVFQAVLFFKVLNYLSSVDLYGRKQCSTCKYQKRLNLTVTPRLHCCGTNYLLSL